MWALGVVEGKVFRQTNQQFVHRSVSVEVHVCVSNARDDVTPEVNVMTTEQACLAVRN